MRQHRTVLRAAGLAVLVAVCSAEGTSAGSYISVPFLKVTNSAFVTDYADKDVQFEAIYAGTNNLTGVTNLMPEEYQQGYISFSVCNDASSVKVAGQTLPSCEGYNSNMLISKEFADPLFSLKQGRRIRISAHAVLENVTFRINGSVMQQLLFVVDHIDPL
jgi:hypothetical protein